jgi:hypothetical protein
MHEHFTELHYSIAEGIIIFLGIALSIFAKSIFPLSNKSMCSEPVINVPHFLQLLEHGIFQCLIVL